MNKLLILIAVIIIAVVVFLFYNNSYSPTSDITPTDSGTVVGDGPQDESNTIETASEIKEFTIDGFTYGYSMNEIRVKKGDRVKIVFTSADGYHDWVLDEFGTRAERINTGDTTSVEFVVDKTGTFEYYCSVGQHRALGMKGSLIVE